MGLLDGLNLDDPKTMGLLSAGLSMLSASGPSRTPTSLGQIIGQGGMAGLQGYGNAQQQQQMNQFKNAQMQKMQADQARQLAMQQATQGMQFNNPNAKAIAPFDLDAAMKMEASSKKEDMPFAITADKFTPGSLAKFQQSRNYADLSPMKLQDPGLTAYQQEQLKIDRARLGLESSRAQSQQDQIDAGKVPLGYRRNMQGNLEAIPGGPADLKTQAQAQIKLTGQTDVGQALGTLRNAYDRLDKGGGITNTDNGALSNMSAATSASGVGQAVGKMFGTENQSARNDIAMTRPALLASLMKATGMSAKQMDSNAELKLWLATATDPTLDVNSNRRALDQIEQKYLGGQTTVGDKSGATPADKSGGVNDDAAALEWAKANPMDPRAIQIKKMHGVK